MTIQDIRTVGFETGRSAHYEGPTPGAAASSGIQQFCRMLGAGGPRVLGSGYMPGEDERHAK